MFDFIRKNLLWKAWNNGLEKEIGARRNFHLKSIQDIAVYNILRELKGNKIAEIGGGNSQILAALAKNNECYNIEKFEGMGNGPTQEIKIDGVTNILAYLGDYSGEIPQGEFDVVFSISVVEHVPGEGMAGFLNEGIDILKPNGLWLHAIDIYIEDKPSPFWLGRYDYYKEWINDPRLEAIGKIYDGPLKFACDMATNPDNVMYEWGRYSPSLIGLRQIAQSVSILAAFRKRAN